MIKFTKKLLDYIYKKKCYFCSRSKENIKFCHECYEKISFLPFKKLDEILNTDVYSCCFYKGIIQKLIRGVKYHRQEELAFYQAKLMMEFWQKIQEKEENYTVVPVPMYKERLKKRKYNHMDLVGLEFCKLAGYEFNNKLIERVKNTIPQYKLSKQQREENLKGAFLVNLNFLPKNPVLIIDDITTTGSTLSETIRELKKNGINNITALTTAIPESNSFYIY